MHHLRTRPLLAGLVGLASAASIVAAVAPAHASGQPLAGSGATPAAVLAAVAAAPGSTVTSDTAIRYFGAGAAANNLTISGFGPARFLLTDTLPLQAGPGCVAQAVPAGLFGVACGRP